MATAKESVKEEGPQRKGWRRILGTSKPKLPSEPTSSASTLQEMEGQKEPVPTKWSMGVLNDKVTDEVPGTNSAPH